MEKDLSALVRLKKWQVDEEQRILADLLKKIADLQNQQRLLEEHLHSEQQVTSDNVESLGFAYGQFANAVVEARAQYQKAVDELEKQVLKQRDKIAEVFREHKTVEQLQKNRDERIRKDLERKEQMIADEMSANVHRRKNLT